MEKENKLEDQVKIQIVLQPKEVGKKIEETILINKEAAMKDLFHSVVKEEN